MCPPQLPRVPRDKNLCVVHPGNLSEKEPSAGVFLSLTGFPIPLPGSPGLAALKNTPCTNICLRICFWRKLNKWCLTLNLPWVVLLPSRLGKKTEKRVFIHSHYWGGEGQRGGKMIHLTRDLLSLKNLQEPLCGMSQQNMTERLWGPDFMGPVQRLPIPLCFYLTPFFPG